jgi:hypothetical protein
MEGSAQGAPFFKKIFFCFQESRVEKKKRIERIGRREEVVTLLQAKLTL